MGWVKDEKFQYYGDSLNRGGGLGQFADLRGGLAEKEGDVFEWGVDTPVHNMDL